MVDITCPTSTEVSQGQFTATWGAQIDLHNVGCRIGKDMPDGTGLGDAIDGVDHKICGTGTRVPRSIIDKRAVHREHRE